MSTRIRKNREARGQSLFLWVKLIAVVAFFAAALLLGANPFTGDLGQEDAPAEAGTNG
ncbi:MAG: hypothetical protein AAFQ81_16630 [Pseudomonadota bacterium]